MKRNIRLIKENKILCSDSEITEVFSNFGEIRHFSRPILKDKKVPSQFAFIKYRDESSAKEAVVSMDNAYIWDSDITVNEANVQDSFFSGNTGKFVLLLTQSRIELKIIKL